MRTIISDPPWKAIDLQRRHKKGFWKVLFNIYHVCTCILFYFVCILAIDVPCHLYDPSKYKNGMHLLVLSPLRPETFINNPHAHTVEMREEPLVNILNGQTIRN